MLDRDELAARCLVAMMSNSASRGRPDEFASDAVTFSDALLARLAETAPAAPPAPTQPTAPASREAVARALREAYQSSVFGGTQVSWESVPEESRNGYLAEADAALALLIPGARWPEAKS